VSSLSIAVFPDNEKNILPVPQLWKGIVPVLNGYFTFGPISVEGLPLPPGKYWVQAAAKGSFLGEVSFEIPGFPSGEELTKKQADLQSQRALYAEKERASLEAKMREATAALQQLKLYSKLAQTKTPKARGDWSRQSAAWRSQMLKAVEEQRSVLSGPMFYPEAQNAIYQMLFETLKGQETLELISKLGPKALQKNNSKSIGQTWLDLDKSQRTLAGMIQVLGASSAGPMKLDLGVVKSQVVETSK
jgi:hypothetical protein